MFRNLELVAQVTQISADKVLSDFININTNQVMHKKNMQRRFSLNIFRSRFTISHDTKTDEGHVLNDVTIRT